MREWREREEFPPASDLVPTTTVSDHVLVAYTFSESKKPRSCSDPLLTLRAAWDTLRKQQTALTG
ncbi:MAG: hypothetical protein OXF02_04795 [Simkaniaceae bacterium]|nr:hypothetical protein [Simkaniaceae bacterium]